MKKSLVVFICLAIAGLTSACDNNGTTAKHVKQTMGIRDVIESRKEAEDKKNEE